MEAATPAIGAAGPALGQ